MFQIVATACDFEWSYTETMLVLEDESVAALVCETLNGLSDEARRRRGIGKKVHFNVKPLTVVKAQSESRVNGLVDGILDTHWPRNR